MARSLGLTLALSEFYAFTDLVGMCATSALSY
ncbi:hypothetical protein Spb1_02000 [Planctopirus ephydatiae]|uniref:Uncharacterized protein n=1 Tax=Planctopirus ephydatiae TaxID=2528019 RepID=A0A518GIC1_9PLAN|nr:hypothetical protein Spb1_02000 [Planctopirus ephydatiae]